MPREMYDDRIEIENPGVLLPPITPDNIKQPHGSYPYNKIIAEVLYKTTYLEQWGSGVQRILNECKKQNALEPTWDERGSFVVVTFPRTDKKRTGKSTGKTTSIIIDLITANPKITIPEMCEATGLSDKGLRKRLNNLKELGIIRREGPTKGGRWVVSQE